MKQTAEPELFAPVQQPGSKHNEKSGLYADVMFLRRCGAKVFRAGCFHHTVNGQRMDATRLRAMAAQWREDLARVRRGHRGRKAVGI